MISESDIKRFNSKFVKGKPDECWEWQAGLGSSGYGRFWWQGKTHQATRLSYMINRSVILTDPEQEVCHTCDNPPCVNPNHLFLGNPKINAIDRNNKGRHNIDYSVHNKNIFKTECKWGHPFDSKNTGIRTNGNRYCIACKNRRTKERNARLKSNG